jgi:fructose 1,6-bisphosphatase
MAKEEDVVVVRKVYLCWFSHNMHFKNSVSDLTIGYRNDRNLPALMNLCHFAVICTSFDTSSIIAHHGLHGNAKFEEIQWKNVKKIILNISTVNI